MRNIALTVSYDGTNFSGWQIQQGLRTVQGEIENALEKIHKQKTSVAGSGRTDAGVHALGQVASFFSPVDSIPAENYLPALNSILPKDVRILDSRQVAEDFHPRFSATSRTYRYFFHCGVPFAHETGYCWQLHFHPDLNRLNKMSEFLHGEKDFATFTAAGDKSESTFRFVESASFFPLGNKIVFEITANAFLWKMIRSIVGTMMDIEKKKLPPQEFLRILESANRKNAGQTAPPHGLFLYRISYDGIKRH
ncbi:MAG: tRNA pseudouridine(38-40) synthase TruA [Spirochaetaceae bacterium]|nr:tRNA pseudouridine(38-40) synthase TruA [Spirochaetaceae bacterium]